MGNTPQGTYRGRESPVGVGHRLAQRGYPSLGPNVTWQGGSVGSCGLSRGQVRSVFPGLPSPTTDRAVTPNDEVLGATRGRNAGPLPATLQDGQVGGLPPKGSCAGRPDQPAGSSVGSAALNRTLHSLAGETVPPV